MSWRYEWDFTTAEVQDILWLLRNAVPGPTLKRPTRKRFSRKKSRLIHALEHAGAKVS